MHHMKKQIYYLVGFNSTRGAIEEAMERLEKDGIKVNHAHIRLIHPFPTDEMITTCRECKSSSSCRKQCNWTAGKYHKNECWTCKQNS